MKVKDVWDMTHLFLTLSMALDRPLNNIILVADPTSFYQCLHKSGFIEDESLIQVEAEAFTSGEKIERGNQLLRPLGIQEESEPEVFAYLLSCFAMSTPGRIRDVISQVRPLILRDVEFWRTCWGEYSPADKMELADYIGNALRPYIDEYRAAYRSRTFSHQ